MNTTIHRYLSPLALFLIHCTNAQSIGTQVHEGPVSTPRHDCFIASNSSGLVWLDAQGAPLATLAMPERLLDAHVNAHTQTLHLLTPDGVQDLAPDGSPIRFHRLDGGGEVTGASARLWGTPRGFITTWGDRSWHEYHVDLATGLDGSTATGWATDPQLPTRVASRSLPTARSVWADGDALFWAGIEPQRSRPAWVETTLGAPLESAVVTDPPFDARDLVADAPSGRVAFASVRQEHLHIRIDDIDVRFATTLVADDTALARFLHLGDANYAVAYADGGITIGDWQTGRSIDVAEASAPLAGPLPCLEPDSAED